MSNEKNWGGKKEKSPDAGVPCAFPAPEMSEPCISPAVQAD